MYTIVTIDSLQQAGFLNWRKLVADKKVKKKKVTAKKADTPKKTTETKVTVAKAKRKAPRFIRPLTSLVGYFKGSWQELRQVRWPNRRASWGLTIAVLIFTGFFTLLIVALDAGFQYLLNRILL